MGIIGQAKESRPEVTGNGGAGREVRGFTFVPKGVTAFVRLFRKSWGGLFTLIVVHLVHQILCHCRRVLIAFIDFGI